MKEYIFYRCYTEDKSGIRYVTSYHLLSSGAKKEAKDSRNGMDGAKLEELRVYPSRANVLKLVNGQ